MKLNKQQIKTLEKKGWTPCQFWFGWDYDTKGNVLDTINKVETLPDAEGYDFLVIGYKKVNN